MYYARFFVSSLFAVAFFNLLITHEGSAQLPDLSEIPLLNQLTNLGQSDSPHSNLPLLESLRNLGRRERSAEDDNDDDNDDERSPKFFFHGIPIITTCNYTAQAGTTCTSCTQRLLCLSNNIGFTITCAGLFRYCNDGRCSLLPGSLCTG